MLPPSRLLLLLPTGLTGGLISPLPSVAASYPPSSSISLILDALLSMLALLLCQGRFPSLGVLGRDPTLLLCGGCLADCALPCVMVELERRDDLRLVVVLVDVLLHRRSRLSAGRRRPSMSRSGVGVVLREELRECDPSLPLGFCSKLCRRFREPVCERLWL